MSDITIGLLVVVIVQFVIGAHREYKLKDEYNRYILIIDNCFSEERKDWQKERKDLMDRIQAPTFAEYTSKVVREKKLEQPQEEEKRPEFIS